MNMSFYLDGWDTAKKEQVYEALERASEVGIIPVTSAGNGGPDLCSLNSGIASQHYVVTVAATDARQVTIHTDPAKLNGTPAVHRIPSFSGRGCQGEDKPDVCAPGAEILTGTVEGSYGRQSGTSFSAPLVSGVVATWVQADPSLTVDQVQHLLEESSLQLPDVAHEAQGHGVIQAYEGLKLIQSRR